MLARANRIARADDFRAAVRRGRKIPTPHTLVYVRNRPEVNDVRFGAIVSKAVGPAVVRNRVRRRLKAIAYVHLDGVRPGTDIVFRALPSAGEAGWRELSTTVGAVLSSVPVAGEDVR